MAVDPTPEQIKRGERVVKWTLAIIFWLAIAPTLYLVGSNVAVVPVGIILSAFGIGGINDSTHPITTMVVQGFGVFAGIGIVWLAWRHARLYYAKRAA